MSGKSVGEDILNSLTVIRGLIQLLFKDDHSREANMIDKEIQNICRLVREYFGLNVTWKGFKGELKN